jgi:low temperature requirement protein LtrA
MSEWSVPPQRPRHHLGAGWFSLPRLHAAPAGEERHATWLELFFDLVFVFAVAELGHLLYQDLTLWGFTNFALLFLPVWWVWTWFAYYADQFDTDSLTDRLTMVVVMFGTLVFALTIHDTFHGQSAAFALAYISLRLLLIGLYIRAARHIPEARDLCTRLVRGFSVGVVLWAVSLAVPEPTRFLLWGAALLIELATPPLSYITARHVPAQDSHMPERYGLFTIIVLGESILAVARGIADLDWQWQELVTALGGFCIAVCMWWLYFERFDASVISQAVHSDRRTLLLSHVYGYSHYVIYIGIAAAATGILVAIEVASTPALDVGGRLALCGGVALFLIGVVAKHWASPRSLQPTLFIGRLVIAGIVILCLFAGVMLSPVLLVVLVAVLLLGVAFWELIQRQRITPERMHVEVSP